MQFYAKNKGNYVLVRHKHTREVDIRRANESSRQSTPSLPLHECVLHYVGAEHTHVCRCSDPGCHGGGASSVASESRHLSASLMLYLDRHSLNSCTIAEFRKYHERQKAHWEREGVYIDDFHYTSRDKNVVCRCRESRKHRYSAPRNPEIVEQCAEFFCLHKGKNMVTKDFWKEVNGDSSPAYSSKVQVGHDHSPNPLLGSSEEKTRSPFSLEEKMRSTAERLASVVPSRRRRTSVPDLQPEMPSQVWQRARSSAYMHQPSTSSIGSTPMGSAFSSTRTDSPVVTDTTRRTDFVLDTSSTRADVNCIIYASKKVDANANVVYGKRGNFFISCSRSSPLGYDNRYQDQPPSQAFENDNHQLRLSPFYANNDLSVPFGFDDGDISVRTPLAELPTRNPPAELPTRTLLAELPTCTSPIELPVGYTRQRHTATLKELEGRSRDTASELGAKSTHFLYETGPNSMPNPARKSVRLSSLFEQASDIMTSSLCSQEEFFLRYAGLPSRADPAHAASCKLCGESHRNTQEHTIMLPDCGCSMHESCLLDNLRELDQQFGRCPFCHVVFCERTLIDRIGADIEAIFELQVTALREDVCIEFLQRSQVVACSSEEGVAVAQLRLVKDYVDVHTGEIFRLWEGNRAEPDWYAGVVRPVVQLFLGWNKSIRSRFFPDQEAFLKLIAWAELVRLMNTTCTATKQEKGSNAQVPQLGELHHKLTLVKGRYNMEKETWDTNRSGVLEHDRIAMDVVEIAMRTHTF